tara:strand:+ start:357 stop:929 length:573 start_codon:yes stop_codon:yes gene_type:complete
MNFVDNQTTIQNLFLLPDKRVSKTGSLKKQYFKGVYIISRDLDDDTFKIGVSYGLGGLYQRLTNYKLCYPYANEYFLQYAIISATGDDAKLLEKSIFTSKILKNVERNESAEGKKSSEYKIVAKKTTLQTAIAKKLTDNPDLWVYLIVFNSTGWRLVPNTGKEITSNDFFKPSTSRATKKSLYGAGRLKK